MSDYPGGQRADTGSGAAAAVAVSLILLLLIGAIGLAGFFYFRVEQKTMMAREAAMRAEAMAQQQAAEAARVQAETELERAEAERDVERQARQESERAKEEAAQYLEEAVMARAQAERLQQELDALKSTVTTPDAADPPSTAGESKELLVHLNAESSVYVNQEPKDWDQITTILDGLKGPVPARVVIVADRECRMEPVLRLMQLAKQRELNVTVSTREFNSADGS